MTRAIGQTDVLPSHGLAAPASERASSAEGVSPGYAAEITSEVVSAGDTTAVERLQPALEAPVEGASSGANLAQLATKASLSGIQAAIRQFSRIDISALDMADSASILLLLKGVLSNMQAMAGAEKIEAALGSLLTRHQDQLNRARAVIVQRLSLADKLALQDEKSSQLSELQTVLEQKQQAQAAAGGNDPELTAAIAGLQQDIAQLEATLDDLDLGIQTLIGDISTNERQLAVELRSEVGQVFALVSQVRQRFDPEAMATGEDERADSRLVNHEQALARVKSREKLREDKKELALLGREQLLDQQQQADERADERQHRRALNRFGINIPDGVLALFGAAELTSIKAFAEKVLNEPPTRPVEAGVEALRRFDEVLRTALVPELRADDKTPASMGLRQTLAALLPELDAPARGQLVEQIATDRQEQAEASARGVEQLAWLRAVDDLASQVLAMVAKAEAERQQTEGEISRHTRA